MIFEKKLTTEKNYPGLPLSLSHAPVYYISLTKVAPKTTSMVKK